MCKLLAEPVGKNCDWQLWQGSWGSLTSCLDPVHPSARQCEQGGMKEMHCNGGPALNHSSFMSAPSEFVDVSFGDDFKLLLPGSRAVNPAGFPGLENQAESYQGVS